MTLEGAASVMQKDYNSAVAIDLTGVSLAGSPLREDRVARASATWSLPVFAKKTGAIDIALHVDYSFVRHRSNDAFYNYRSHALGLGTSIAY
jgi:hypothetical protein